MDKNEYNDIPVHYCKYCLFLGNPETVNLGDIQVEFCPHCGSTDFEESHINEWENKFKDLYKQGEFLKIDKTWKKIMQSSNNPLL